ncbi:MAG: hypothetical protein IKZ35_01285 [Clostridia bacterium]|nr:hypothetical protein [Clostridia bacterium]
MRKKGLFPNLEAEQGRLSLNDNDVAMILKISRESYCKKKKRGNFKLTEIICLLNYFKKDFSYLFEQRSA